MKPVAELGQHGTGHLLVRLAENGHVESDYLRKIGAGATRPMFVTPPSFVDVLEVPESSPRYN
jgi:hypothetical protein